jgi:DNA-binding beta-propeller fold protein YncE
MRFRLSLSPSAARAAAAFALLSASAACSSPEPGIAYTYDPYAGDAYPNHRPKIDIPPGGVGIVSDSLSDTLSLLDLTTGERLGSYPVGREPVTIDGPHHIVADPARGSVFIGLSYPVDASSLGPHASHGASLIPGYVQKLALDDMRIVGQVRVDPNPGDVALSQDGSRLVVSHFDLQRAVANPGNLEAARSTLAVLDPEAILLSGSPIPRRIPICIAPHGITLSRPDGARAFVACYGEDALGIADLTDPSAPIKRIPVGGDASLYSPVYGPYAAVMSADGGLIAVSNTVSKDVRFFDVAAETFDPARTIKTLGAPFFAAFSADGSRLFIPTQQPDALVVIDLTQGNNAEILSRPFAADECEKPHVAEVHEGGDLFLVCEGDWKNPGRVLKIDPGSLESIASAEVGVYPDGLVRVMPKP